MPENKERFWRSETAGESRGREHTSSGPGCDGKKMNVSVLSAQSAFKTRVPTYPTRSCPEPAGHPALFRAGCGAENRTVRVSLLASSAPTHGGPPAPQRVDLGLSPSQGHGLRAWAQAVGAMSLHRDAALTRETPSPGWLRPRPRPTEGAQPAKLLVCTGRSGRGLNVCLRRVRSHGNSELPGPAPVHKRRGGNSPGGAYPTTAAGAAQRKHVMRRCTGRDGAGRKLHLPESSAEGPCLLAGLLAGCGSAEKGGASRDPPQAAPGPLSPAPGRAPASVRWPTC